MQRQIAIGLGNAAIVIPWKRPGSGYSYMHVNGHAHKKQTTIAEYQGIVSDECKECERTLLRPLIFGKGLLGPRALHGINAVQGFSRPIYLARHALDAPGIPAANSRIVCSARSLRFLLRALAEGGIKFNVRASIWMLMALS